MGPDAPPFLSSQMPTASESGSAAKTRSWPAWTPSKIHGARGTVETRRKPRSLPSRHRRDCRHVSCTTQHFHPLRWPSGRDKHPRKYSSHVQRPLRPPQRTAPPHIRSRLPASVFSSASVDRRGEQPLLGSGQDHHLHRKHRIDGRQSFKIQHCRRGQGGPFIFAAQLPHLAGDCAG